MSVQRIYTIYQRNKERSYIFVTSVYAQEFQKSIKNLLPILTVCQISGIYYEIEVKYLS